MANEPEKKLEQLIHRELRQLPDMQAPAFLVQRVRATLEARAKLPWYKRSWFAWPLAIRMASAGICALLVVGLGLAIHQLAFSGSHLLASVTQSHTAMMVSNVLGALGNALVLAVKSMSPVYLAGILGFLVLIYVSCIALGTVCYRIAWQKR